MRIKELLTGRKPILADGAMGTWYAEQTGESSFSEYANLTDPQRILAIHRSYIDAGAQLIRTNTFSANPFTLQLGWTKVEELLAAGYRIAKEAAGIEAGVLCSIGPVPAEADGVSTYVRMARYFISLGAEAILFETFDSSHDLLQVIKELRSGGFEGVIGTTFAVMPDGFSMNGESAANLLRDMTAEEDSQPDFLGFNCTSGPLHLRRVISKLQMQNLPVAVLPNAGYPATSRGHVHYGGTPAYFAEEMLELRDLGIDILGGCCGTTPEHIRAMRDQFEKTPRKKSANVRLQIADRRDEAKSTQANSFMEKLESGKRPIAVEYDSPQVADFQKYAQGLKAYKAAGVDAITIADCPIGRARMDSSLVALLIKKDYDMEAIPHLTCRDRNLNAIKALLLALNSQGIYNQIVVTGDPIPTAQRDEIRSVFNFNSEKLTRFISQMNQELFDEPLQTSCAFNVNAPNIKAELRRAHQKVDAGAVCFFTQPVLSEQALHNLQMLKDQVDAKVMGGIMPVVSERNARYMMNELSGIVLDESLYNRYVGLDKEEASELAYETSIEYARQMAPYVDGYYLMTPFHRTDLIVRIVEWISRSL